MQIDLPCGKRYLAAEVPSDSIIISPKNLPILRDAQAPVRRALNHSMGSPKLSRIAKPQSKVTVVVNNITRPTPFYLLLPEIIRELSGAGVRFLDERCKVRISEESDMTITTPGGYPKDINLHFNTGFEGGSAQNYQMHFCIR